MSRKHWTLYTPAERDDANRLGALYETFLNNLHNGLKQDAFTGVMASAFAAEFALLDAGVYPPVGHDYPRLED
ncbi:hypothetical protein ACF07Y_06935 [Streptomyces sp. NPDC016566]|uniref:hypothetical protein n=1 Tax=Streptomyces sp. NPDC016566 TaxID=3364967 RepID=UPI0036FA56F1